MGTHFQWWKKGVAGLPRCTFCHSVQGHPVAWTSDPWKSLTVLPHRVLVTLASSGRAAPALLVFPHSLLWEPPVLSGFSSQDALGLHSTLVSAQTGLWERPHHHPWLSQTSLRLTTPIITMPATSCSFVQQVLLAGHPASVLHSQPPVPTPAREDAHRK